MQLVLDTPGIILSRKGNAFHIKSEKGVRNIAPAKISSIAVTADVLLHSNAVRLSVEKEIPILFFDRMGKIKARMWSPYFASIAKLRRSQLRFSDSTAASSWVVDIMLLKTEAQIDNLQFIAKRKIGILRLADAGSRQLRQNKRNFEQYRKLLPEQARNGIMGTEGSIARIYWQQVGQSLPGVFSFQKRSRRPAADIFNALLNYTYGMLYGIVESGLFAAGLDPHLGVLHVDAYRKPTLAFDLIEAFRPWFDRLLIEECLHNRPKKSFFTANQHGIFLNKHGKAYLIPLFNGFLRSERNWLGRKASVRNQIYFLAGKLAQRIRTYAD